MADESNTGIEEGAEQIEAEARELGWAPKDQWRGNPERWIDAKTFVERSETVLPIVQKTNKDLKLTVRQLTNQVAQLTGELRATSASMKAIEESHAADVEAQLKATKAEIGRQLKEAKEEGDTTREVELIDQLTDLKAAERTAKEAPKAEDPPARKATPLSAEYLAWRERNDWIDTDPRRARRAMLIAQELAEEHEGKLTGKAFFDKLDQELAAFEGRSAPRQRAEDKTSGARPRESGGGGKSYNDLPAEAKEVCARDAKKVVGPDRAFKDLASWQKEYARLYFGQE